METQQRTEEQLRAVRDSITSLEEMNFRMMVENRNPIERRNIVNQINSLRRTQDQLIQNLTMMEGPNMMDNREVLDVVSRRILTARQDLARALEGDVAFGRDPRVLIPTLENTIERLVRSRDTLLMETMRQEEREQERVREEQQEQERVLQESVRTAEEDTRLREELENRRQAEEARIAELRALPSYQEVVGRDMDLPDDDTDEELEEIAERMVGRDLLEDDEPALEA